MIHNWAEEVVVRPRTGIIVEREGVFLSNYVCMRPVKSLQMYPTTRLVGHGAVALYNTILVGLPGSDLDVGSRVVLERPHTRAEIVTRTISTGGWIVARGHLIGLAPEVKAHLECRGLILSEEGMIYAVPELEGRVAGVDMSHEATVGKIAQEEIEYLMARGLDRNQATAAIVRGFLKVEIVGLPPQLREELDWAISKVQEEVF